MSLKNKITIEDYIKANKISNREIEIKHKVHKNKKKYTRKNFKISL